MTDGQLDRTNKIFKVIKEFERMFPEEFSKCGIVGCGHCGSTGVSNKQALTYCPYCGGTGYIGFKKIYGEFVCRTCNGGGCDLCHNGVVDWIVHANGGDILKRK